jgi:outer membrane protein
VNKSVIVNIVLGIAVIVLYILHFTAKPQSVTATSDPKAKTDSLVKTINTTPEQKESKIVYLNIDTLFEKYEYYKLVSEQTEKTIKGYQATYEKKVYDFQQKYQDYVDRAGAGLIPKEEAMKIEEQLMNEKNAIMQMEQNQDALEQKAGKDLEVVQKKLNEFFKAFTKANNYSCILTYTAKGVGALGVDESLDVTDQIIKGLNEEYKESLKNQPTKK